MSEISKRINDYFFSLKENVEYRLTDEFCSMFEHELKDSKKSNTNNFIEGTNFRFQRQGSKFRIFLDGETNGETKYYRELFDFFKGFVNLSMALYYYGQNNFLPFSLVNAFLDRAFEEVVNHENKEIIIDGKTYILYLVEN